MRLVWSIVAILAVAHLLALAGFVGWLVSTDRLNGARVERVRQMLATTLSAEASAQAEAESARLDEEAQRAQAERMAVPPEGAAEQLARQQEAEAVESQRLLRLRREIEDLRGALQIEREKLTREQAALSAEKSAFEAYRARIRETESSAQFKNALATLESQKPRDAKLILAALIGDGQTEQAVAYLGAMDDRVRGKVMAEFVKDDSAVAADLLERLRNRGIDLPAGAGSGQGAGALSAADPP